MALYLLRPVTGLVLRAGTDDPGRFDGPPELFDLIVTDAAATSCQAHVFTLEGFTVVGLTSLTVPNATTGTPTFSLQFTGVGGTGPYTTTMTPTTATPRTCAPPGMTLSSRRSAVGHTDEQRGYQWVMTLQDAVGATLTRTFPAQRRQPDWPFHHQHEHGRPAQTESDLHAGEARSRGRRINFLQLVGDRRGDFAPPGITLVSDPALVGSNTTILGGQ